MTMSDKTVPWMRRPLTNGAALGFLLGYVLVGPLLGRLISLGTGMP